MRWKCVCSYDGTDFNGWQSQPGGNTVQDVLENRLKFIFGRPVRVHGSGRTDAGVHANYQVFHFDGDWPHGAVGLVRAFGCGIPKTVRVFSSEEVDLSFHARFSATGKRYKYHLLEGQASPFNYRYVWELPRHRLDVGKMNETAKFFVGEHDFSQFGAAGGDDSEKNAVKTMNEMHFTSTENGVVFTVSGSGFLYKMVRILVGCFVQVGLGNIDGSELVSALGNPDACPRNFRRECAPARGLFLDAVQYGGNSVAGW
jgi:tRNA pseudouridine38-40 synthase